MKKFYKLILIICVIISMYSILYDVSAKDIWDDAGSFINTGANSGNGKLFNTFKDLSSTSMKTRIGSILGFLWGLGLLVIFISTVVLGIKYMLVQPNEKSRLKQATTPYIIGVVIIFGAITIWQLVIQILEG